MYCRVCNIPGNQHIHQEGRKGSTLLCGSSTVCEMVSYYLKTNWDKIKTNFVNPRATTSKQRGTESKSIVEMKWNTKVINPKEDRKTNKEHKDNQNKKQMLDLKLIILIN